MDPSTHRPKCIVSLTFRGFEMKPAELETLIGRPASLLVQRGEPRNFGGSPFSRSAASWKLEFVDSTRIAEMIPALLNHVGGMQNLAAAKRLARPEFIEFDISLWILHSEEQEGGGIEASTLAALAQLDATLSFGFYRQNDA